MQGQPRSTPHLRRSSLSSRVMTAPVSTPLATAALSGDRSPLLRADRTAIDELTRNRLVASPKSASPSTKPTS